VLNNSKKEKPGSRPGSSKHCQKQLNMSDTNIPTDTLQFVDALKIIFAQSTERYQTVAAEFKKRYTEIEDRIGNCSSINQLAALNQTQKFYKQVAEVLDLQNEALLFIDRQFAGIDEDYWNTVINGRHLIQQNEFMKHTIGVLQAREDLTVSCWKADRRKWYNERITGNRAA
jgi:hypothetical protein